MFSDNPIRYADPNGDDVKNGDRILADKQKGKSDAASNKLSNFKKDNNITDNMTKKDFVKSGGNASIWKEYSSIRKESKKELNLFNTMNARANITQTIIDKWAKNSPNLFQEVDKQSIDFILFSESSEIMKQEGISGQNLVDLDEGRGDDLNPVLASLKANMAYAVTVRIADNVLITANDPSTGEYSLNHEAGHFLYTVLFTCDYISYLKDMKARNIDNIGGHHPNDEAGKIAEKYGRMRDIPKPIPIIMQSGN